MTEGYKLYLKKIKITNIFIHITRLLILLLFIIIWQYLADKKIINTFITSSPKEIIKTTINLYKENNLLHHIYITTTETIISFLIASILGIIISIILWTNKFLFKVIDPYLTILNSLPKVSLGPILIIWFGSNTKSIIIMAILVSIITTIINMHNAFNETDKNKIKLLKSFNANQFQILKYLILPANYKTIISSIKINWSLCLIGIIMGELLVSKSGIGYLIMYGSQVFNLNLVMTSIIILMLLSYIMYLIISYIEKILINNN